MSSQREGLNVWSQLARKKMQGFEPQKEVEEQHSSGVKKDAVFSNGTN
jgi:hypothetical protein